MRRYLSKMKNRNLQDEQLLYCYHSDINLLLTLLTKHHRRIQLKEHYYVNRFQQQEFNIQLMNTEMIVKISKHFDSLSPVDR